MGPRQFVHFLVLLLGLGVAACGGSGSSGFDTFPESENAAIDQALQEQRCINRQGLTICPAGQAAEGLATPTPSLPSTTPTREPGPTATPTPTLAPGPGISADVSPATPVLCMATQAACTFTVAFLPHGFPQSAVYRIATRTAEPPGPWMIGSPVAASAPAASIDAPVFLNPPAKPTDGQTPVQLAVLVFLDAQHVPPASVDELAASGANFAFVTDALTVVPD